MCKWIAQCLTCLFLTSSGAYAQLYVITGSPTPKRHEAFAADLVRVSDGTASISEPLVSAAMVGRSHVEGGVFWIALSQEARKAVLVPQSTGTSHLLVVDFDAAAVTKQCDWPDLPMPTLYYHLAELPGRGSALVAEMFAEDGHNKFAGMLLDRSVPCENSLVDMAPTDILGLQVSGRAGVSDTGNHDAVDVGVDGTGAVAMRTWGVSFPFKIPGSMLEGLVNPISVVLVDNARLVAIGLFAKASPHRILVYRKSDRTWHQLPIPHERVFVADGQSTPAPWLTGFGDFLALSEAHTKDAEFPETAGRAAWRNARIATGPSIAERFRQEGVVFPGRLHLYDVAHDRSYTITTNQGDSEILLVEDGIVYYRVNDAIYKCTIGDSALGPAQLLAKSEILGDAHWAFIRH